jgi:hypothetical protein
MIDSTLDAVRTLGFRGRQQTVGQPITTAVPKFDRGERAGMVARAVVRNGFAP